MEPHYREQWISSVNRLLNETDPARLESLQAEARVWERVVSMPHRLLEVHKQEHN